MCAQCAYVCLVPMCVWYACVCMHACECVCASTSMYVYMCVVWVNEYMLVCMREWVCVCVRLREIDNMETTNKLETDFENYTMGIKQELFKENIYPYSACCHSNHVHNNICGQN